jgi:hypothetical protein
MRGIRAHGFRRFCAARLAISFRRFGSTEVALAAPPFLPVAARGRVVRVAGTFGVYAFDGAAFVLPPLRGALTWVVCARGAIVGHDPNMGPNP